MGEVGWETPTEDLTWCTTEQDVFKADIRVSGDNARRAGAKSGFKVLVTMVAFDNTFAVEVSYRLARATKTLWSSWELLGCVSIPLPKRLQIFRAAVEASCLSGARAHGASVLSSFKE